MRAVIQGGTVDVGVLALSFLLNLAFLGASFWYFVKSFKHSVSLGLGRFN